MDIRKFTLKNDDVEFKQILSLLSENTNNETTKNSIEKCKNAHSQLQQSYPVVKLVIDGNEESIDARVKKWLYGYYLHDQDKNIAALSKLGAGKEFDKFLFISAIIDLAKLSIIIAHNAEKILAEELLVNNNE